jgi:hypothetical protein
VTLSPTSLGFPTTKAGRTSTLTLTVTNSGTAALSLTGASISGTNASNFRIGADGCTGKTVAVGATCTISVNFTPTVKAPAVTLTATLSLVDNAGTQTVQLTGKGN